MMRKKPSLSVRLIGTKEQIQFVVANLQGKFSGRSNGDFYAQINQPGLYSYYLENFWPVSPDVIEITPPKQHKTHTEKELRHSRKMAFWLAGKCKPPKP